MGKGGTGTLFINNKRVGTGRIERTQPMIFSADETADAGVDLATPVVEAYYAAISASWLALTPTSAVVSPTPLDPQAWAIYHDSLARLILEGQWRARLDPRRDLTINPLRRIQV